jgi:hypothetical protein
MSEPLDKRTLILHKEQSEAPLPRLRRPRSSIRTLIVIMVAFILGCTLISMFSSREDTEYGRRVADLILSNANTNTLDKDSHNSSDFIQLDVDGLTIKTIFPTTWSVRQDGRQHVIVSSDKQIVCQSLIYGIEDFNALSKAADGDLLSAEKEIIYRSLRSTAPPGARVIVRGSRISSTEGIRPRVLLEFGSETSIGSRRISNSIYTLWTHNATQAVHLTCSQINASEDEKDTLRRLVEGYEIAGKS